MTMDEPKKGFESGATPGMLKNPFGTKGPGEAKGHGLQKKGFEPGKTPGQLKHPFRKKTKSKSMAFTRIVPKPRGSSIPKRMPTPKPEPYWLRVSKSMFDQVRMEKNLSDAQIEWIKEVAQLMPSLLVKVPSFTQISIEDVEAAILIESAENLRLIIETKAENFDPVRTTNKTFGQLSKKNRALFWTTLAEKVLAKLTS